MTLNNIYGGVDPTILTSILRQRLATVERLITLERKREQSENALSKASASGSLVALTSEHDWLLLLIKSVEDGVI